MIKIFGIERSCTNYVKALITLNFHILPFSTIFGHKHHRVNPEAFVKEHPDTELFFKTCTVKTVICCKNPYHWYKSIMDYARYTPEQKEKNPAKLLKWYNDMYLHWYDELIENEHPFFHPAIIIKHEDLLRDLKGTLNLIGPVYNPVNIDKVRISNRFTNERREYYLRPLEMPQDERVMINEIISDEFFRKYKYNRILI